MKTERLAESRKWLGINFWRPVILRLHGLDTSRVVFSSPWLKFDVFFLSSLFCSTLIKMLLVCAFLLISSLFSYSGKKSWENLIDQVHKSSKEGRDAVHVPKPCNACTAWSVVNAQRKMSIRLLWKFIAPGSIQLYRLVYVCSLILNSSWQVFVGTSIVVVVIVANMLSKLVTVTIVQCQRNPVVIHMGQNL